MAKRDQPEHRLSHYVAMLLDRIVLEPAWFTAVDHAARPMNVRPEAVMRWEQQRRAMGVKPGQLDFYVYQAPRFAQIELKTATGTLRPHQETTIRLLTERSIPAACCRSVLEVQEFLAAANFHLHGNAHNIAIEIEARWRAADSAARPAQKKRRGGPVKPKGLPPSVEDVMGWT